MMNTCWAGARWPEIYGDDIDMTSLGSFWRDVICALSPSTRRRQCLPAA